MMESYQQADGSVVVPAVLRPYTGFHAIPAPYGAVRLLWPWPFAIVTLPALWGCGSVEGVLR